MKITCETATLADAVGRASRVAPTVTSAYHKAAGLLFEVEPVSMTPLVLKSTDLEITYRQQVPVAEASGEPGTWRIPSTLLNGFLAALPLGAGQTVTIEDGDGPFVVVHSGRTRAKVRLIEGEFPLIERFHDTGEMVEVEDFAQRVEQVAWACHPNDAPFSGVHMDGEHIVATDREKVVLVPCPVPVAEPITVPLTSLLGLLRNTSSVSVRASERKFELMTDDETQASTVIYGVAYPPYRRVLRDDYAHESRVDREIFASALNRLMVIGRGIKLPRIRFTFREGSLSLQMAAEDVGVIRDELDLVDGPSEPWSAWYTPQNFVSALAAATKPEVTLRYGPGPLQSLAVVDGTGWRAEIMPRAEGSTPGEDDS